MNFRRFKNLGLSLLGRVPDSKQTVRTEAGRTWKVHRLSKPRLFSNLRNCAVFNRRGLLETELFWDESHPPETRSTPETIASHIKNSANLKKRKLRGSTLCLHTPHAAHNYYHWMIDLLPRLDLFQRSSWGRLPIRRYLIPSSKKYPYQVKTLELLGVPPERILFHSSAQEIFADVLFIPDMPEDFRDNHMNRLCHPWQYEFLRRSFLPHAKAPQGTGRKGIYVRRSDSRFGRHVPNEEEVEALMLRYDIEPVSLASLDVTEQAGLFASTSLIVGVHGAGLTNTVFAPPEATLVEIHAETFSPDCFRQMTRALGHRYLDMVLPPEAASPAQAVVFENLHIDLKRLEATLERACKKT